MLVLLFLLGFIFAYKPFIRGQYTWCLGVLLICSLLIKIWACANPWLHDWDERYHALVARNLLHHFFKPTLYDTPVIPYDYKNWTANHIWLHKQPVALWLIAGSLKIFGYSAFAVRIPSILLSSLSVVLIYKTGKEWFTEKTGLIAAFLLSVNGLIIDLVSGNNNTDHVDIAFFTLVLLCVWLIIKATRKKSTGFHVLAGLVLGLAVLTKWLPALTVIPVWLLLAVHSYKGERGKAFLHLGILLFCAAVVCLPWQLFILHRYPAEAAWEYRYNALHFTHALEGHDGSWFYHFDSLRMLYGETVYIPVLWFLYTTLKDRTKEFMVISTWFLLPFLFFSFSATKMPAYTLLASPAIFLMTAVFFRKCMEWIRMRNRFRVLIILVASSLIALPVRYAIERLKPFDDKSADKKSYLNAMNLKKSMPEPQRTIVFNYPDPIELMFYTGCTAYPFKPADSIITRLKANYFVVVMP